VTRGALAPLRVLELGELEAAAYCGKLFADLGAEVIKVERPGGDPSRRQGPTVSTSTGSRESAFFAWLNTNKQSVILERGDQAWLGALAAACDIVVDGRPSRAAARWRQALQAQRPATTIVSLSWFGESGPYRDYLGGDLIVSALAGVLWPVGRSGEPPQAICDHQASIVGGLNAFTAALAAQMGTRGGRRFEVSLLEASLSLSEFYEVVAQANNAPEHRYGHNRFRPTFPMGVYRCREGWLGVTITTLDQWRGFCQLLALTDEAANPDYAMAMGRFRDADELEARYAPRLLERTASEWFAAALEMRLPFAIVPDMAELARSPVHRDRGAFASVEIGGANFEAPALPQRLTTPRQPANGPAPVAGAHTERWRSPAARTSPGAPEPALRPLSGLRIIDLTMGWAGPLATRQLADLGAEVIKVESCGYADWWRGADPRPDAVRDHQFEKSPIFNAVNRNKKGVTLDLTQPEGADLLRRLVAKADAVIENYSQGVLPKLGLDYASLRKVNPSLVMVSMTAFGGGNAWSDARAYGSTLEHGSGAPTVAGCGEEPPTMTHLALGDPIGGLNAAAALVAALFHRVRTGVGQHVDLSQVECLFPLIAAAAIEQSVAGHVTRWGDRQAGCAWQGALRCLGDDDWVLVRVEDASALHRLCALVGRGELAHPDEEGPSPAAASAIGAWASTRTADEAMAALQGAGVAAGAVRRPGELQADPHLQARRAWSWVARPWIGVHSQTLAPFREEGAPYPVVHPSPLLGEFNEPVLQEVLGLRQAEIDGLASRGVIGNEVVASTRTSLRRPA
jgi:crotonobetainyl-CoA:carnitine CoA-transferase CaiB-like acyl-CoA transferase